MRHFLLLSIIILHATSSAAGAQDRVAVADKGNATKIAAPGTGVQVNDQGVVVDAPGVGVKVDANGVAVNVAGVEVAVEGADTNVVDGRERTAAEAAQAASTKVMFTDISVTGNVKSYACKTGESLSISGTSAVYKLSGACDTLKVSGTSNVVTVQTIREINVTGTANRIRWVSAAQGDKPIVTVTGVGNAVDQNARGND